MPLFSFENQKGSLPLELPFISRQKRFNAMRSTFSSKLAVVEATSDCENYPLPKPAGRHSKPDCKPRKLILVNPEK